MIKRYLFLLIPALIFVGCSSKGDTGVGDKLATIKTEFNTFCDQFEVLTQSKEFLTLDTEERAEKLDKMLVESMSTSGNAYIAWYAIRSGPPSERYALMQDAANSSGYSEWTCESLKKYAIEVGRL